MKILFFIRSLIVGGSQRQLTMLADGLARRGHHVLTAVFYTGGEIEAARTHPRVVALGKAGRWDVVGPLSRLRRLMLDERPDVIYAFHPTQTVLSTLLRPAQLPIRLVFGLRAAGMQPDRDDVLSLLSYRLEALLSRRADLIIANAHAGRAAAIARGFPSDRVAVVANGIDIDKMRPDVEGGRTQRRAWGIADDAFVVGCVARLDPVKDHANFLAAAARFSKQAPDAWFVCVGDGPTAYRAELAARARLLGVADRIVWAGEVDNVAAAYSAFNIATLTSSFGEGCPNVVGEAMACGIPVVGTDVGDVRAIIGKLGEVVPVQKPELLSAGWQQLRRRLQDQVELRDMVRQSIAVKYSVETMVRRTEELLLRMVATASL